MTLIPTNNCSETCDLTDIRDSEICPRGYVLHRKDRTNKTGGGVLLAIKNEYNSEHVPELDTDCEIVWANMNLKGTVPSMFAPTTEEMSQMRTV